MIDTGFDPSYLEYRRKLAFALAMRENVAPRLATAHSLQKRFARLIRALLFGASN